MFFKVHIEDMHLRTSAMCFLFKKIILLLIEEQLLSILSQISPTHFQRDREQGG